MKKLFVAGTIAVLGCSLWVSVNHTLNLFRAGGYTNNLEWFATAAAEISFLMGILSIFDSRKKGTTPHWSAKMLFYLGLVVVGWSNVRAGIAYGWTGVIEGMLVPIFLFGAEAVLSHEYIKQSMQKETSSNNIQPDMSRNEIQMEISRHDNLQPDKLDKPDKSSENIVQPVLSIQNQPDNLSNDTIQPDMTSDDMTQQNTSSHESLQLTKSSEDNVQKNMSSDENIRLEKSGDDNVQPDKSSDEKIQSEKSNDENVQPDNVSNKKSNVVNLANRSRRKKKNTAAEIARVKELAIRFQQQNGELPGRPTLMELADCSEYVAKQVLKDLKETG